MTRVNRHPVVADSIEIDDHTYLRAKSMLMILSLSVEHSENSRIQMKFHALMD